MEAFFSALLIGLLGAGHCIGMCGGIGSALTFAIAKGDRITRAKILVAYNFGRVSSYVFIGVLAASLAAQIQKLGFPYFRVLAAILMIFMGLYLSGIWRALTWLERGGKLIWRYLQPLGNRLMPVKDIKSALLLGAIWGWLPCGLVYTALAFSAAQANLVDGALVMFAFGLGTMPAVVSGSLVAGIFKAVIQGKFFRYLSALAMILFGIWTIYGAIGHHGHHSHHNPHQSLDAAPTSNNMDSHEHHHH